MSNDFKLKNTRKILHVDMDAFFASVEQRDNPELRGKPLIVGGEPKSRGVVAAASYEARKFGIHSAMSSNNAYKLCPEAIFIRPRFTIYKRISRMILGILKSYSDFVEPLSIDEAFLDVTKNKKGHYYASRLAKELRQEIYDKSGLTASAGLAPNKFLAKIASDLNKPDGLAVIMPDEAFDFLTDLPVRKIPGIGRVAEKKLLKEGILKVGQIRNIPEEKLIRLFGKSGKTYHQLAYGIDNREVIVNRERKSIGAERTFSTDTLNIDFLEERLLEISKELILRIENNNFKGRTLSLKATYSDFSKITRSISYDLEIETKDIYSSALNLLNTIDSGIKPIRLLGLSIKNKVKEKKYEDRLPLIFL